MLLKDPFFEATAAFLFGLGVFLFVSGLIVILTELNKYHKLESVLAKEVGGITKKIIPALETNIYTFHDRIVQSKMYIGLLCIILSIALFFFKQYVMDFIQFVR